MQQIQFPHNASLFCLSALAANGSQKDIHRALYAFCMIHTNFSTGQNSHPNAPILAEIFLGLRPEILKLHLLGTLTDYPQHGLCSREQLQESPSHPLASRTRHVTCISWQRELL
jgi:hypothetical protein